MRTPWQAPPPAWRAGAGERAALAALALAWALLFAPQLVGGGVFVLGDAGAYRPFAEFSRAHWRATHERALWNPYVFCGLPSAVSLADARPQYLPDAALDALDALTGLPGWPPLALPLFAHLAGMLCVAWLARGLWRAGPAGMTAAGLAWGLMPNVLAPFAYGHDAQVVAASLMPAVLLAVHAMVAAPALRAAAGPGLALALALGLQLLAGHPQITVYSTMLALAFALERERRYRRPARLLAVAGGMLLGGAMAMAVWWPALLYGRASSRGGAGGVGLEEVARYSLALRDLATLAWPKAVGGGGPRYWGGLVETEYPQFLGLAAIALALLGWPRRGAAGRAAARFWALAAGVAVLLALGSRLGPAYALLQRAIPFWSTFRVAVMSLYVAQLALALLAALGVERALAAPLEPARGRRGAALVLVAGALLALGAALALGPLAGAYAALARQARPSMAADVALAAARAAGADLVLRAVIAAGVAAALVLASRARRRVAAGMLVAAIALDLGLVGVPYLHQAAGPPSRLVPRPSPLARAGADDTLGRVMALRGSELFSNDWVTWRVRALAGNHGSPPRPMAELLHTGLPRRAAVIRAFAVHHIGAGAGAMDTTLYEAVVRGGREWPVWRVRGALPRAYPAAQVLALEDGDAARAMRSAAFAPEQVAITDDPAASGVYPGSAACRLRWVEDAPDRLVLETEAADRAFVVVADAFFPGWHATVDGERVAIHRVDLALRGVAVPAGRHRLEMRYVAEGWPLGVAVTRLALALWIALAGMWVIRALRGAPAAAPPARRLRA